MNTDKMTTAEPREMDRQAPLFIQATYKNDTYGELSREELADLRRVALRCQYCGMLATVDPAFHATRYAHAPIVSRGGVTFTWSPQQHSWLVSYDAR
jgi:hypothetical protein